MEDVDDGATDVGAWVRVVPVGGGRPDAVAVGAEADDEAEAGRALGPIVRAPMPLAGVVVAVVATLDADRKLAQSTRELAGKCVHFARMQLQLTSNKTETCLMMLTLIRCHLTGR